MASSSKRARVSFISAEIALEKIFYDEDTADGMDSGEESDLDRQIEVRSQYRPSRNDWLKWLISRVLLEIWLQIDFCDSVNQ